MCVVAGAVCMSIAHNVTLKIEVYFMIHKFKPAELSCITLQPGHNFIPAPEKFCRHWPVTCRELLLQCVPLHVPTMYDSADL